MYDGLRMEQWTHTANVMALVANCHRDGRRSRAFHAVDFMPADLKREIRSSSGVRLTSANLKMLKPMFGGHS